MGGASQTQNQIKPETNRAIPRNNSADFQIVCVIAQYGHHVQPAYASRVEEKGGE
jgi:hypothetical protein